MKQELRAEMKKRLKASGGTQAQAALCLPEEAETLFIYISLGSEIGTKAIAEHAFSLGKTIAAPRVVGDELSFHRIASLDDQIVAGAYGIREPLATAERLFPSPESVLRFPLVILVPGLAFDRAGRRLGRGAGYYDRFLSAFLSAFHDRRKDITLVGVCHSFQIVDLVPTDRHDIPVDCLLTEKNCILVNK